MLNLVNSYETLILSYISSSLLLLKHFFSHFFSFYNCTHLCSFTFIIITTILIYNYCLFIFQIPDILKETEYTTNLEWVKVLRITCPKNGFIQPISIIWKGYIVGSGKGSTSNSLWTKQYLYLFTRYMRLSRRKVHLFKDKMILKPNMNVNKKYSATS